MADDAEQIVSPVSTLLVIDDDVLDRLGSTVRQLCVGMIDEVVRVMVLARSTRRIEEAIGPSQLFHLPRRCWPWHWQRLKPDQALNLIGDEKPDVIHCMSAHLLRVVRDWVMEWGSRVVVQLTDLSDIHCFLGLRLPPELIVICTTPTLQQSLVLSLIHI